MAGRAYTIFDTSIGRCGIAWGHAGIVGVQLPEAREIETRKRLYHLYPNSREMRPPPNVGLGGVDFRDFRLGANQIQGCFWGRQSWV